MSGTTRLTLMVRVDDTVRADIALTPERTYYRFATDSSIEDGELAAVGGDFQSITDSLINEAAAREGEQPLARDVRVQIFVNNRLCAATVSEQSLNRLIDALQPLADEFAFLRGFRG